MAKTLGFPELRNPPLSSVSAGPGNGQRAANPCRRFGRGVGFWLGAVLLGLGGGILGGWMPYQHPVAVACAVPWWGIYFGCFGAWLGALVGLWAEQTFPPPSQEEKGSRPPFCSSPGPQVSRSGEAREICGRVPWNGQETVPQQMLAVSATPGDCADFAARAGANDTAGFRGGEPRPFAASDRKLSPINPRGE